MTDWWDQPPQLFGELQFDQGDASAWYELGLFCYQTADYQAALNALFNALELEAGTAAYHYALGLTFEKLQNFSAAAIAYQEAIALEPDLIEAYQALGHLLFEYGNLEQAELIYRQAIALDPSYWGNQLRLGNILLAQEKLTEAIATYEVALRLHPENPDLVNNLTLVHFLQQHPAQTCLYFAEQANQRENYSQAVLQYQKFLELEVGTVEVYTALASCYQSLQQYESAIATYRTALELYPAQISFYSSLIIALQTAGYTEAALETVEQALQIFPHDLGLRLIEMRIFPVIYQTTEDIQIYRDRFTEKLQILVEQTRLDILAERQAALANLSLSTNFYLSYQGFNDLDLQQIYGEFVCQIMQVSYPNWTKALPMPPRTPDGKIRIGYVSTAMGPRRLGELTLGWLKHCDRQQFEIYSYYLDPKVDALTQAFSQFSDVFHQLPGDLETTCRQILADQLHILVFTDIGVDSRMTTLTGLRLAPVQCTTWSHPVTTGLPTIDYFLSSELMEPPNAASHYSETLVPLPNIGVSIAKPEIPEATKSRTDFGLGEQRIVYLCCQALFKYLPQHDFIFAEIARQLPEAQFVFLAHQSQHVTEQFAQRLQSAFARLQLNSQDYCLISPRLNEQDYLNLNQICDVFLDALSWSGGITTLKAIACNLPVITCPSNLMRGRHTYAILQVLEMTETIAANAIEYIELAVKLGQNPQLRQQISQRIADRQIHLFHDLECVTGLETFYQQVFQAAQA